MKREQVRLIRNRKLKLVIRKGVWWTIVHESGGWREWAPVGEVSSFEPFEAWMMAGLANAYRELGLLGNLVGHGFRENGSQIEEIVFQKLKKPEEWQALLRGKEAGC